MANKKDSLGDRMKLNYENRSKTYLTRRTPVIIRLDGCHFHTFTRGFVKPFDKRLIETMQETTLALCKEIQGCVLGYTQSDEITLVLVDYKSLDSEAWFDYGIQKICSVAASKVTKHFNRIFAEKTAGIINRYYNDFLPNKEKYNYLIDDVRKLVGSYERALKQGAEFDARAFNIPVSEVTNCVLWRQQDATRNSISGLAQAHFSNKELHGKNTNQMQDMLMEKCGINWNNIDTCEKRGTCVIKTDDGWKIDTEIPIFTGDGRKYIEDLIAES
jgi:tRNA(His) 5'-end guanylyltransferase